MTGSGGRKIWDESAWECVQVRRRRPKTGTYCQEVLTRADGRVGQGVRGRIAEAWRWLTAILFAAYQSTARFVSRFAEVRESNGGQQTRKSGLGRPTVILTMFVAEIVTARDRSLSSTRKLQAGLGEFD
jgi:hypothetical protein